MLAQPTRVLLADDHPLILEPLRQLLGRHEGIEVVGVCGDGLEAVKSAERLRPDVVLLDVNMPLLNGIDACRQIKKLDPHIRVILVSGNDDPARVRDAVQAGAAGYVMKTAEIDELVLAIAAVRHGNSYFSAQLADVIDIQQVIADAHNHAPRDRSQLSERERQVLQLVAEGQTGKVIARELGISEKTVESHKTRIMVKLSARNRMDLLRQAIRMGLVQSEPGQAVAQPAP